MASFKGSRFAKISAILLVFSTTLKLSSLSFALTNSQNPSWEFPWDECVSMDQIVGRKCETKYYICDFGDTWFTREVLCNNCIGDCPPGRVFDNITEGCVWPNTIGCSCSEPGQILGTRCDVKFYVCSLVNEDWATEEKLCEIGTVFNPLSSACHPPQLIGC